MDRETRAKDIANLLYKPDWDNSDASSDEKNYNSPFRLATTDRIKQAKNSPLFEEEPIGKKTQETATLQLLLLPVS